MGIVTTPRDVLLVVDLQNDFLPGGALEVPDAGAVVPLANRLAGAFAHVLLTQDWHPPGHRSFASGHAGRVPFEVVELDYGPQVLWPDHCVQGTRGAEFAASLAIPQAELVIRKGCRRDVDSYSVFCEADRRTRTGLAGYLRERGFTRVFIAGLATDFCVAWSALDARADGFDALVVEDACRAIDKGGSLAAAWERMRAAGVARVRTTDFPA
ncbi:MAG: bifunctional nicotinamidase/pyrazinamidase [Betaproteobacteria bacterium]|jgi:nicotinamidase/pyrazinamidase|nr:bifunctional nicotinamidase/pyrazinamidase [Betaproteobacteria bacterium]